MCKTTSYLCLFLGLIIATNGVCKDLGAFGATYEIVEKDFLHEMQEKAQHANWSKIINKKKLLDSVKNYRPDLKSIPAAKNDRVFTVSMSHTLEFDITDEKGTIIYPKGYTFNPLEFVNYDKSLVIINAADRKQVEWFTSSLYLKDIKATLTITDGSHYDLISNVKRPVYYATPALLEKFRIAAVPSVVTQKGNLMEIREIRVREGNTK